MLIPGYHPPDGGGAGQLRGLLGQIDRERFAPFVLTRRAGDELGPARVDATPVVRLPVAPRPMMLFLSTARYLWKHRKDYDVIHVHSLGEMALAGAFIKRLIRQKTFVLRIPRFGQGSSLHRMTSTRLGRSQLQYLLRHADAVIPPTGQAAELLQAWGVSGHKIARLPSGVDSDQFRPALEDEKRVLKRSFGIDENAFVGVVVARLTAQSNVSLALKAWGRLCKSHPDSVLIVVGDGPQGPRLSALAESDLQPGSVIFIGGTCRRDVARMLRTADAYVSYSSSVEVSNAMLEAMSCGLPVVVARTPPAEETVKHMETGFLFDSRQPMDGADYIIRLAEDPNLARSMSVLARRYAKTAHSFEKATRALERRYGMGPTGSEERLSIQAPDQTGRTVEIPRDRSRPQPRQQQTQQPRKSRRSRKKRKKRLKVAQ
jgi:glycosyltransferase involved in cell wall biosynthesis